MILRLYLISGLDHNAHLTFLNGGQCGDQALILKRRQRLKLTSRLFCAAICWAVMTSGTISFAGDRVPITAIGIPLADHYPAIVAYEKYRHLMQTAEFKLKLLPGPRLVRAYFFSEVDADIAFNVCPMVMDMFIQKPIFRWISLIHRDGNALTINKYICDQVDIPMDKRGRLPDDKVADAIKSYRAEFNEPVRIAVPSLLATHTTILYKYLKEHNLSFGLRRSEDVDVVLDIVRPPDAPVYLKKQAARGRMAAFEQSLPWPEVAELKHTGQISWYSKDVMNHEKGHVECVIIAKNEAIREKRAALQEVINYIHLAGRDIESARIKGGKELEEIVNMVQKHIPEHSRESIIQSLRSDLNVINYLNLNIDDNAKASFTAIMALAYEAGFIKRKIDIELLADESFSTIPTD